MRRDAAHDNRLLSFEALGDAAQIRRCDADVQRRLARHHDRDRHRRHQTGGRRETAPPPSRRPRARPRPPAGRHPLATPPPRWPRARPRPPAGRHPLVPRVQIRRRVRCPGALLHSQLPARTAASLCAPRTPLLCRRLRLRRGGHRGGARQQWLNVRADALLASFSVVRVVRTGFGAADVRAGAGDVVLVAARTDAGRRAAASRDEPGARRRRAAASPSTRPRHRPRRYILRRRLDAAADAAGAPAPTPWSNGSLRTSTLGRASSVSSLPMASRTTPGSPSASRRPPSRCRSSAATTRAARS